MAKTDEIKVIPVVPLSGGWDTFLAGSARQALEKSILPHFLQGQRWFGGKARRVKAVRLVDWRVLPKGPEMGWLVVVRVEYAAGASDLYFLPLGVARDSSGEPPPSLKSYVVARLRGPHGEGFLYDLVADDDACEAWVSAWKSPGELPTRVGIIRGFPTEAYPSLRGRAEEALPVTRLPATSSNSLVLYGQRLLIKIFRRLEEGINPDFEVGRFLTEKTRFDRFPRTGGALEYHRPGSEPITLAILQEFIPNQGSGWQHVLEEMGRYFERTRGRGADLPAPENRPVLELAQSEPPTVVRETVAGYLDIAATLGRRTGEMHLALGSDPGDPAFAPEPLTAADLTALTRGLREQAHEAVAALKDNLGRLSGATEQQARRLLQDVPGFLEGLRELPTQFGETAKIRCHGDYHLGQVLWVDNDFIILDFEGEPARSVAERRVKQPPLKDVAGMLRSFNYAAYAGLFAFTQDRPAELERLEPWADLWQKWTAAAFLMAYRKATTEAHLLPDDPREFQALLQLLVLDKAFYELIYELNNRPDWVRIPLEGILALMKGIGSRE
ncbi:MAG: putative maltokinase [Planctomycetes bacterium]|nr:putative maltokinase [Planctomycetota bacterium]